MWTLFGSGSAAAPPVSYLGCPGSKATRVAPAPEYRCAVKRLDGYAPIGAYGAIRHRRNVALVALDGSIDFLSLPNLHSPTTFAALLDPERGGRFALAPEGEFESERRYVERTNVLETVFRTASGSVRVTDALTLEDGVLLPWVELARRVEGLEGSVRMRWSVEPRFDWGRAEPRIRMRRGTPVAEGADVLVAMQAWDAGEPGVADGRVGSTFETSPGPRALLALTAVQFCPVPIPHRDDVERRIDGTCAGWRRWLDHWDYDGPWAEAVARSALALRLLVHTPDGAIAAAPTTSLPERIGGDRNYDYRYAWVRDSAFTPRGKRASTTKPPRPAPSTTAPLWGIGADEDPGFGGLDALRHYTISK